MKNKMKFIYAVTFLFAALLAFDGCSKLNNDGLTNPSTLKFHPDGIKKPSSANFHGKLIKQKNWNMAECQQCHGGNFTGGPSAPTCNKCHSSADGPLACNTCHGSFSDASRLAPPRYVIDSTNKSVVHWNHMYDNKIGAKVTCGNCHNVPSSFSDSRHINGEATVVLKGLAAYQNNGTPTYDKTKKTCANTYCHGNFVFYKDSANITNQFAYTSDKMVGNNFTPDWTKVDGSQKYCNTCHGLPPIGHMPVPANQCAACHPSVVDENGNIVDINKHINGEKNVRLGKK